MLGGEFMFCAKCGNQMEEGALFCKQCGAKLTGESNVDRVENNPPPPPNSIPPEVSVNSSKEQLYKKIIIPIAAGIIVLIIVLILGLNGKFTSGDKYVAMVKGGHPLDYPDKTYETTFNGFFDKPEWKYLKAENGLDIVQFDGECTYYGKPAHMVIQFDVDAKEGKFDIYAIEIDGVPQNKLDIGVIHNTIFSN